jgi:hypothetical protein
VYELLGKQLDRSYTVFYSSPWLGTTATGAEIDGEADFVVAHPDHGILVIEVKGGRIRIDENNQWYSTSRDGITFRIKNPVAQARTSKYHLLEKLKASNKIADRWITVRHGVVLPDVTRENKVLRPDMPPEMFAFADDMDRLDQWVDSRFAPATASEDLPESPFGIDGVNALQDLLARPIEFRVPVGVDVEGDLRAIHLLSEEQYWTIRDLQNNRRMKISGAAGTGKTLLAVHKAVLLAHEEGKRVLLLCFNRALSLHLQKKVVEYPLIEVSSFHNFFASCLLRADVQVPVNDTDYTAEMLLEATVKIELEEFDAIIIDEGQDFRPEWLAMTEMLLRSPSNGVFYIFYDANQNVMSRESSFIDEIEFSCHLHKNFRNTRRIFEKAEPYYSGEPTRAVGPEGVDVVFHTIESGTAAGGVLADRIGDLIHNENLRQDEIAVLVADSGEISRIAPNSSIGRYTTVNAESISDRSLILDTVRRFKGLESPVVLLLLPEVSRDDLDLLYTGITRAQSLLEIFGSERAIRRVRSKSDTE